MENPKRARSGKPRKQPREGTYVSSLDLQSALERIRQAASRGKKLRFTGLWHHVYGVNRLRDAYYKLKRKAAPGVDGETWKHYGEHLEENLQDLSGRLRRGAYRARPVRRAYIPKPDGSVRGLRVTVLEDKIVQRATAEVMSAIYEEDFLGFSYGFRPGRSPHDALDALYAGIMVKPVSWGLETDIRGYFDAMDHGWLVRFVERRIADQRVVRHIKKWLHRICGKGCGQSSKRSKENSGGGMQNPVPAVGQWLRTVLLGQYRYYRVESNGRNLGAFRNQITQLRYRTFRRRSQRHQLTRERMTRFENRWLPLPRIVHSYLDFRQYVTI